MCSLCLSKFVFILKCEILYVFMIALKFASAIRNKLKIFFIILVFLRDMLSQKIKDYSIIHVLMLPY